MLFSEGFISDAKSVVAIIDDSYSSRAVLKSLLSTDYNILEADNAEQGLHIVTESVPDLVLLDVFMPDSTGLQLCNQIKANQKTAHIPVIFLTSANEISQKVKGYKVGAADYITKPFEPDEVLLRVDYTLRDNRERRSLENLNLMLDKAIKDRTAQIEFARDAMLGTLVALAEVRDNETGSHILRTQHYVMVLGLKAYESGIYKGDITRKSVDYMFRAAPLHDIGKVGICDSILQKPGPLSFQERENMKQHTIIGSNVIQVAEKHIGETPLMRYVKDIIISHHERWDGKGYPLQLAGDEIPLPGRIMAIADVYDALISKRVYKDAYTHEDAVQMIIEQKGKQFDPQLVDCFLESENQFKIISSKYDLSGG